MKKFSHMTAAALMLLLLLSITGLYFCCYGKFLLDRKGEMLYTFNL